MLSQRKIWLNGKLVPFNQANVHIMSHSFCRGSAVFEVMSLNATKTGPAVFRLDDHIARLSLSADQVRMKLPYSPSRLKQAVKETVKANRIQSGMLKLMAYYGEVEFEVIPRNPKVTVAVVAVDTKADLGGERFNKSARKPAEINISDWRKPDPRTVPVECKSAASYIGGMIAKLDAMNEGYTGTILLDLAGNVAEGATESIFIVRDGILKTPTLGNILSGITRRTVIEVAQDIGITVKETKLKPRDLLTADELFFTSSVAKIWPIGRVEDKPLCAPGEMTRLLDAVLDKINAGLAPSYRKWLTVIK